MSYPRGSEWRRWDLHIHTPETFKNDQFAGATVDEKWDRFYNDISDYIGDGQDPRRSIAVIGITDYFSTANYNKVVSEGRLPKTVKLVLPNVELRITPVTGSGSPVNIHCIFDPAIADDLENRFFSQLQFNGGGSRYNCSENDLIRYGRDLANDPHLNSGEALKRAIESTVISFSDLHAVFNENQELRNHVIIAVANGSRDGLAGCRSHIDYLEQSGSQLDSLIQSIHQFSDVIFSGNPRDRDYFLGLKDGFDQNYIRQKYRNLKACLHGSDAHSNSQLFAPSQNRFCWIKADPTFQGLKQVVNEPSDRVIIGEEPEVLSRVSKNSTKYIKALKVSTIPEKEIQNEVWFNEVDIPLNKELVAIIGNKGSGKSAVADIIGLCADAEHPSHFQFLHKDRFLKKGYADRFYSQLEFYSNSHTEERVLDHSIDVTAVPKVQYLPQSYFESICNELGTALKFRKEIEKVVFQHIPDEQKLGKGSFSELMAHKDKGVIGEIRGIKQRIAELNDEIIVLEDKKNPAHRETINNHVKSKKEELEAHRRAMPEAVQEPQKSDEKTLTSDGRELKRWEEELEKWNERLSIEEESIRVLAIEIEELNQLRREFENKESELKTFVSSKREVANKYKLELDTLLKLEFNLQPLIDLIRNKEEERLKSIAALGKEEDVENANFDELAMRGRVLYCENKIAEITNRLSKEEQNYQKYLIEQTKWQKQLNLIIGDKETPGGLEYYEAQLAYLDNQLDKDLSEKRQARIALSMEIFAKKLEIKKFYDQIKVAIDEQLARLETSSLYIDTSLILSPDFTSSFMNHVDKGRQGSFRGVADGRAHLGSLIEDVDWDDADQVREFLVLTIEHFEHDYRNSTKGEPMVIGSQIPKRNEFYHFLFCLDYLEPVYELKQGEKTLEELSPGEKGALLLIFYLSLDKNDTPLLIDQPEDNLDNKSVATVLVPYIKKAKKRRQIIMVTHNPNLAVVADAEQVIRVDIDKENGNEFSYVSGSIENGDINNAIVEVLEGTMPAFTARKNKYRT